ncbi:MAG: hypothetical protein C4518_17035 [Desulfobacteraceae bacterium]|nr:MAG: hypothetical protein C4518_17035 [Desulfobacteraceae bacterium]
MKMTDFFLFRGFRRSGGLLVVGVLLAVLASACCVSKKYDGPGLPKEEITLIRPDDKEFTPVNILSIDGKVLKTTESSVTVLPGQHVLFVEAMLDYPLFSKQLYFNMHLPFEAEAGDTYTVHATILPMKKKGFVWLTSEKNPEKFIAKEYATNMMLIHFE